MHQTWQIQSVFRKTDRSVNLDIFMYNCQTNELFFHFTDVLSNMSQYTITQQEMLKIIVLILEHPWAVGHYKCYNKLSNYISCQFIYCFCSKAKATLATFGGLRHFWAISLWLTLDNPCMTFDPINALHFSQGFFLQNLVAIGYS